MITPLSNENMRRLDRYCPDQPPYKKASKLGQPNAEGYEPYAAEITADLKSRKRITLYESYYLYFFSIVLDRLGAKTARLALDHATDRCEVIDPQGVQDGYLGLSVDIPGLENIKKVNWKFLPNPENLSPRELLELLKRHFSEQSGHSNIRFEIDRIEFALSLKPQEIFVGLDEFSGYYAFVFSGTIVLFECPAYGNAAYIVRGDWRVLSQQYKAQLERTGIRVIHGVRSWRSSIRRAIRST